MDVLINTGLGIIFGYGVCRVHFAMRRRKAWKDAKAIADQTTMLVRQPKMEKGVSKIFKLCYVANTGINMPVLKRLSEEYVSYFDRVN